MKVKPTGVIDRLDEGYERKGVKYISKEDLARTRRMELSE